MARTKWKWRGQTKTKTLILPNQYYLTTNFEYNHESGIFSKDGNPVGSNMGTYYQVSINSTSYYVHRLIWKYVTGEEPNIIDHINGNGLDNRWINLRNVAHIANSRNRKQHNNGSGITGVTFNHARDRWRADICCSGKTHYLGSYINALDAIQARIEAEEIFWGKSHVHTNLK